MYICIIYKYVYIFILKSVIYIKKKLINIGLAGIRLNFVQSSWPLHYLSWRSHYLRCGCLTKLVSTHHGGKAIASFLQKLTHKYIPYLVYSV